MTDNLDTKLCMYCDEPILKTALVCKHCGREQNIKQSNLQGTGVATAGLIMLVIGLVVVGGAILVPLGLMLLVVGVVMRASQRSKLKARQKRQ